MAGKRFRDVSDVVYGPEIICCVNSVGITMGSDVLRGRCSNAISERYQGLTNLTLEVTVEANSPFIDIHPGDNEELIFQIAGATRTTGLPDIGIGITVNGAVCTTHSASIEKDSLGTGTYVFRAISVDGLSTPITCEEGIEAGDSSGSPRSFIRDIGAFTWTPDSPGASALDGNNFCTTSFEFSENSELIEDSCQGELWSSYVGITGLNLTASITGRSICEAIAAAGARVSSGEGSGTGSGLSGLGAKGEISFRALVGSDESCVALVDGPQVLLRRMNVNEVTINASTGEIADVTLSWTGHGEVGELTDESLRAIAVYSGANQCAI